ncbi:MAG TPA: acyl carrier protein, partial [Thermoanaerobaculia bacterium]
MRPSPPGERIPSSRDELLAAPPAARSALILALLRRQSARILELPPARLRVDRSLTAHGLDSLAAAELAGAIETALGVKVDLASLLEGPTLAQLGEQVLRLVEESAAAPPGTRGARAPEAAAAATQSPATAPPNRYP